MPLHFFATSVPTGSAAPNYNNDALTGDAQTGVAIGSVTVSPGLVGGAKQVVAIGNGANISPQANASVAIGEDANVGQYANNSVALGAGADAPGTVSGAYQTALGSNAKASGNSSVAVGYNSQATTANEFSIGAPGAERTITNVAPGVNPTDAVNMSQLTGAGGGTSGPALPVKPNTITADPDTGAIFATNGNVSDDGGGNFTYTAPVSGLYRFTLVGFGGIGGSVYFDSNPPQVMAVGGGGGGGTLEVLYQLSANDTLSGDIVTYLGGGDVTLDTYSAAMGAQGDLQDNSGGGPPFDPLTIGRGGAGGVNDLPNSSTYPSYVVKNITGGCGGDGQSSTDGSGNVTVWEGTGGASSLCGQYRAGGVGPDSAPNPNPGYGGGGPGAYWTGPNAPTYMGGAKGGFGVIIVEEPWS
jgi:hypothetical protein